MCFCIVCVSVLPVCFCINCVSVSPVCFKLFVWVFYQCVLYCLCECSTSFFILFV